MSTPSDQEQRAREFQGLMGVLEQLGRGTETLFARVYSALSARDKVMVDAKALHQYKHKAELIRDRARRQTLDLARLTGILGLLEEGVVMQGPNGRIILMNETAKNLLGSQKNWWTSPLGQMFRAAAQVPPVPQQMQMIGEPRQVQVNGVFLAVRLAAINSEEGEHLGTVMLLRPASAPPTSAVDRLKDSFVAQMSHELRTPLTAIKGMSEVILNLPEGKPPKRSFLEAINRNVATLDRMVVELLDLSELSTGVLEVRRDPLALDEVMFTVLKGFEARLAKANLNHLTMVKNPSALQIRGDSRRLQWALGHLIENAIHYTLAGGEINIQMGRVVREQVLLEISDTGVGIQPQDLPRIFERFYRGEARTPDGRVLDPRGVGQGLFIAEAVVRAHGGEIAAASVVGQGSTFSVRLPLPH
jgi:two-component system phosphate regulon sensor histidine kinase PhoR